MHSKIQGLIYNKSDEEQLKLILLKEKLPISSQKLNWIMINICSILLELAGRKQIMFPKITLDSIYISLDLNNSLPYIKSYEDIKVPSEQRYEYAKIQMQTILYQLNYEENINDEKNLNLQEIQVKLLKKIGYQEDSATDFTNQFQGFLQIKQNIIVHEQKTVTRVDSIKTPSFILGVQEDEIIMKTYKQKEEYERREVDIIEKFTDNQQPKLYSYIRYNNILILFLKKHMISLCQLIANCMTKRKNQKNINLDELKYKAHLKIYHSMIKSLENLHSQNIIHRDLKPDNIMFDSNNEIKSLNNLLIDNLTCVLIDYDRSKKLIYTEQQQQTNYIGNKIFRPPEGKQIIWSPSYDVWQMGLIWMLSLKEVFVSNPQQFNNNQEMKNLFDIRDINYDQFIKHVVQLQNHIQIEQDDDLYQLIQQMIKSNPNDRPTVQNIKNKIELLIQL